MIDTPDKKTNGISESASQSLEKAVVYVETLSEIPDGYDAAGTAIQFILDEPGYERRGE